MPNVGRLLYRSSADVDGGGTGWPPIAAGSATDDDALTSGVTDVLVL